MTQITSDYFIIPPSLQEWFNDRDTFEHGNSILKPEEGLVNDPIAMEKMFGQIDRRTVRLLRNRMKPGFNKEVSGKARIVVGMLSYLEFDAYLERASCPIRPTKVRELSKKVYGLDSNHKCQAHTIIAEWMNGRTPEFPHKKDWAFVKYLDFDTNEIHRAWVLGFKFVYDTYNCTLRIEFSYTTEYFNEHYQEWKEA